MHLFQMEVTQVLKEIAMSYHTSQQLRNHIAETAATLQQHCKLQTANIFKNSSQTTEEKHLSESKSIIYDTNHYIGLLPSPRKRKHYLDQCQTFQQAATKELRHYKEIDRRMIQSQPSSREHLDKGKGNARRSSHC